MAEKTESNRKTILVLLGLLLLALAVRLVVFHNRQAIDFDETAYARMAENLVNGRGLYEISAKSTTHFTPLFSVLIAGVSFVVKDFELAGRLVSLASGLALVLGTYFLGKTLYDRRVGLVAAALVAVFPSLVNFSSILYAESLYTFLLVFGVLAGWLALTRRKPLLGLAAGLLFGLGYVARPEGFFYLPAFVILFVLVIIFAQRKLDASKAAALFVVGFLIFAVPYIVYLHS
ncbi:MAG: glycosyltransferase family 39 protein, partial [Chloroflexi bacterium]|nr:glycosyltransferase family 39 protein [Chloroflexota bacterium]